MAKITWNFTLQSTPCENAKLKCSKISTLQICQIKMQLNYSVLQNNLRLVHQQTTGIITLYFSRLCLCSVDWYVQRL